MLSRARRLTVAAMLFVTLGTIGAYTATASALTSSPRLAAEPPAPFAVEDLNYPNSAQILAEKGIKLIRGDGNITLADCDDTKKQIRVVTVVEPNVNRQRFYCFTAHSTSGQLTLELARVYAIDAADHPLSADLTANGATQTVNIPKDGYASVGEGTVGGARSVLVEIRITG
ncbi:hypothetical protein [Streptomyces sp. XY332]|uniref:hypothetical protein n=1 Tax=Streptomyces sp. XY332 TaxID=1415561 RepID=UPI000A785352|nr:hypothetical protein [Streptomyces sp. XY332]